MESQTAQKDVAQKDAVDVSSFGTTFTGTLYTSQVSHDAGDLHVNSCGGKVILQAAGGVDIGTPGTLTVIKGDVHVEGKIITNDTAPLCGDVVSEDKPFETNTMTVHGDSSFGGSLDVAGPATVNGSLTVGGAILPGGNVTVESTSSLASTASTKFLVFGDQSEGSWRIGVSENNRLTFQRHNGVSWITLGQLGEKN